MQERSSRRLFSATKEERTCALRLIVGRRALTNLDKISVPQRRTYTCIVDQLSIVLFPNVHITLHLFGNWSPMAWPM